MEPTFDEVCKKAKENSHLRIMSKNTAAWSKKTDAEDRKSEIEIEIEAKEEGLDIVERAGEEDNRL